MADAKTVPVTWLGDADASVQMITQNGVTFVKGEPENVAIDNPALLLFTENPTFSVDKAAI